MDELRASGHVRPPRARRGAARPTPTGDPWARLVRGDGWDGDANAPGGPNGWAPLLYVCIPVFASADLARELLARGADPNVTFTQRVRRDAARSTARPASIHDPELTRLLLEAGADPDDGESALPRDRGAATRSACGCCSSYGATPEPIVLAHALDDERPEHVRLLLDAGADATELLPFAVRRGRGPEFLRLLVEHGAELEHRGGEDWRKPERLRTAYQHAVLRGARRRPRTRWPSSARDTARRRRRPRGRRDRPRRAAGDGPDRARLRPAGGADPGRAARRRWRTSSSSTAPTSTAWSAARRRPRCSSTSAGSATPSTRGSCSPRAPRSATRSTGACTVPSTTRSPGATTSAWPRRSDAGHRGAAPGAGRRPARRVARSTAPTVSPNAT